MGKTPRTIILTPCTSSHAAKKFAQYLELPVVNSR